MTAKPGQPTKYKKEFAKQAEKICLLGATDEFLADYFEVCIATISNWKNAHPEFLEAIKRGKQEADLKVAESLYHRALGYSHKETKIATFEGKITDMVDVEKHYAPDPTSIIFWLKNRQPKVWRDKQEVTQETTVHHIMPVPTANSVEDWEQASEETHAANLQNRS